MSQSKLQNKTNPRFFQIFVSDGFVLVMSPCVQAFILPLGQSFSLETSDHKTAVKKYSEWIFLFCALFIFCFLFSNVARHVYTRTASFRQPVYPPSSSASSCALLHK